MTKLTVHRAVAATPEMVWRTVTDIPHTAAVLKAVTRVEILDPGPGGEFGVGTRWRETRKIMGKEATEEMWVTACTPESSYRVEADSRNTHYVSTVSVEHHHAGGTLATMTMAGEPTGRIGRTLDKTLGRVFAPIARRGLAGDLADIARSVE